jgi:hypothetical protein
LLGGELLGEVVSFVELSVDLLNGLTKLGLILAERFDLEGTGLENELK